MAGKHLNGTVNEQVFSEHPVVNYLETAPQEYDITGKPVGTFDFMDKGTFSHQDYSKALLLKLTSLSKSRIPEFLEYQKGLLKNPQLWLKDLEALIEKNMMALNNFKLGVVEAISAAIGDALQNDPVTKSPQVTWKGSDAELLELIVSLVEAGRISGPKGQKNTAAAIRAFEEMFGEQIKTPWKKIDKFKTRKRSQTPFLNVLIRTFEQWVSSK